MYPPRYNKGPITVIQAIGRGVIHIVEIEGNVTTWQSAYWEKNKGRRDTTDKNSVCESRRQQRCGIILNKRISSQ